jgi:hypothetical protein
LEPLCSAGRNRKWGSHYGKLHGSTSKKLKIITVYPSNATPLLIYPKELETRSQRNSILMFTAALFAIFKTWKQLTCPSVDD